MAGPRPFISISISTTTSASVLFCDFLLLYKSTPLDTGYRTSVAEQHIYTASMFSRIYLIVLSALLVVEVAAHTVITYPGWRGDNLITNDTFPYGMQWMYPCEYTFTFCSFMLWDWEWGVWCGIYGRRGCWSQRETKHPLFLPPQLPPLLISNINLSLHPKRDLLTHLQAAACPQQQTAPSGPQPAAP